MSALRKKAIKEDQFYTAVDRIYLYVASNTEKFLYPAMAIFGVALVAYGAWLYLEHRQNKASYYLYEALISAQTETSAEKKIAAFESVIEKHPRSDAAQLAHWHVMEQTFLQWNYDEALPALENFARRKDDLGILSKFKLAQIYGSLDRYDEAIAILKDDLFTSGQDLITHDLLTLTMARLYGEEGNFREAENNYLAILNDFPDSALKPVAARELEALKQAEEAKKPK